MGISQTIKSIKNEIINIKNNGYLSSIELPDNYWSFTMSQSELKQIVERDTNHKLDNIAQNKLYFFNGENGKNKRWDWEENFLRPRTDWRIEQGDYIVKPKKKKIKIFRKNDLKNFLSSFWYLVFSLLIIYLVLDFVTKVD
jgi:ATP-dependent exoDNAse (exonuclease V) alpha subunit